MRKAMVVGVAIASLVVVGLVWSAGDLNPMERRLVSRHGRSAFEAPTWLSGSPAERGLMLADLFKRHRFEGIASHEVRALGENDCYVLYDDEPCYIVALDGIRYDLQFAVNHSYELGEVVGVRLKPQK
jgi:hypothetical protein